MAVFIRGLLKRPASILSVEAIYPPLQTLLESFVDKWCRRHSIRLAIDDFPDLWRVRDYRVFVCVYDIFDLTTLWFERCFEFSRIETRLPDYAMAYKLAAANFVQRKHADILVLGALARQHGGTPLRLVGVPAETKGLYQAYFGKELAVRRSQGIPLTLRRLANVFVALATSIVTVLWITSRIRLSSRVSSPPFLLADGIGFQNDFEIWEELSDGGDQLVVRRGDYLFEHWPEAASNMKFCHRGDGRLSLKSAVSLGIESVRDAIRIVLAASAQPVPMFYAVASLPYKRAQCRALFERFRPRYFWGHDSYNPDHILRRQELNRIGAKSLGQLTSNGPLANRLGFNSFISFDHFFVYGRGQYERYYKSTWAQDMEVVAAGSCVLSRRQQAEIAAIERTSSDIAVFTSYLARFEDPQLRDFVRTLATTFPDRTVWLQVKKHFRHLAATQRFLDSCTSGLGNVVVTEESVFEIVKKARFAFSDPSTIVTELIPMGVQTFMVDIIPEHRTCHYRDYPGICVSSPAEAIDRIRSIENGHWQYPWKDYVGLSGDSKLNVYDEIRARAGLPPRGPKAASTSSHVKY